VDPYWVEESEMTLTEGVVFVAVVVVVAYETWKLCAGVRFGR
jgi:hypothetical protein